MTIPGSINLNVAFFFAPAGLNTLHIILNGTIETFCVVILKFPLFSFIGNQPLASPAINVCGHTKTTLHDRT